MTGGMDGALRGVKMKVHTVSLRDVCEETHDVAVLVLGDRKVEPNRQLLSILLFSLDKTYVTWVYILDRIMAGLIHDRDYYGRNYLVLFLVTSAGRHCGPFPGQRSRPKWRLPLNPQNLWSRCHRLEISACYSLGV